jgi:hypothetical protein
VIAETIDRLTVVLGNDFRIRPRIVDRVLPGASGKFRVVESSVGR